MSSRWLFAVPLLFVPMTLATAGGPRQRADVIVVVGAAGEPEYGDAFAHWAERWQQAAEATDARLVRIGPQPAHDPPDVEPEAGEGDGNESPAVEDDASSEVDDNARLREALASLDRQGDRPVWLVMMGHGTFGGSVAKFNLRGPDVSAEQLADWLPPLQRPLVVVCAFSCSGPFINALSAEGRVIVTATSSGAQQNYSRFGDYLSRYIADPQADIDHDGEVSILEAFLAAAAGVRDFYRSADRLQTERPLIDDNGDALGTPPTAFRGTRAAVEAAQPDQQVDGLLASRLVLLPATDRPPLNEQELARRDELEAELDRRHRQRQQWSEQEYESAVLPLLTELAKLYQKADQRAKATETPNEAEMPEGEIEARQERTEPTGQAAEAPLRPDRD